jgi:hypothetical protein
MREPMMSHPYSSEVQQPMHAGPFWAAINTRPRLHTADLRPPEP